MTDAAVTDRDVQPAVLQQDPDPLRHPRAQDRPLLTRAHRQARLLRRLGRRQPPRPDRHSPTIGILLCAGRNDNVVRYSLVNTTAPLAVADYTDDTLPAAVRDAVPTDGEPTALAEHALPHAPTDAPVCGTGCGRSTPCRVPTEIETPEGSQACVCDQGVLARRHPHLPTNCGSPVCVLPRRDRHTSPADGPTPDAPALALPEPDHRATAARTGLPGLEPQRRPRRKASRRRDDHQAEPAAVRQPSDPTTPVAAQGRSVSPPGLGPHRSPLAHARPATARDRRIPQREGADRCRLRACRRTPTTVRAPGEQRCCTSQRR